MGLAESLRSDFWISVLPQGALSLVSVHGDLDLASTPNLEHTLRRLEPGHVAVDLGAVPFIDSGSVRVLLVAKKRTEARGSTFTVINPSAVVRRLLSLLDPQGIRFGIVATVRTVKLNAPHLVIKEGVS